LNCEKKDEGKAGEMPNDIAYRLVQILYFD